MTTSGIRVLSVGIGTFLIAASVILWIILAILGRLFRLTWCVRVGGAAGHTLLTVNTQPPNPQSPNPPPPPSPTRPRRPVIVGGAVTVLMILVLVLSPRDSGTSAAASLPHYAVAYTSYYTGLILMGVMMAVGAVGACAAYTSLTLPTVRHARAIE